MNIIEREELKDKLDRGESFKLVMTMNAWAFAATHITGSINIHNPHDAQEHLSLDDEIVVYCTSKTCTASVYAYHAFHAAGYKNTRRYAGGLEDWTEAGYPVEGSAA